MDNVEKYLRSWIFFGLKILKRLGEISMMEDLYKKYGKIKVYLAMSLILITLNIVILSITYQVKIRFSIDGERFKYISHTERLILLEDSKGNEVKVDMENRNYCLFSIAEKYEVNYKNKIIRVDNSNWMGKGAVISLSDGSEYTKEFIKIVPTDSNETKTPIPFDVQLVNNIEYVYNFVKEGSSLVFFFSSIPLIFLGASFIVYPQATRIEDFAIILGVILIGCALLAPFILS